MDRFKRIMVITAIIFVAMMIARYATAGSVTLAPGVWDVNKVIKYQPNRNITVFGILVCEEQLETCGLWQVNDDGGNGMYFSDMKQAIMVDASGLGFFVKRQLKNGEPVAATLNIKLLNPELYYYYINEFIE